MPGNILLVDDDNDFLFVLKAILDDKGYTVYTARNLDEAIATTQKHRVDLAIIDFLIQGCQGDLMAKVLKRIKQKLEIIFLSGHEDVYEAVDRLNFPVYEIFMKPANLDEILSTIRSIFAEEHKPHRRIESYENVFSYI